MTRKKIYVLDTSVYLTNADCIYAYKNHDIYVPLKGLCLNVFKNELLFKDKNIEEF